MNASVFIATSMDGFIAREDGALDWLPGDDVEDHGYTEFMSTVDAIVMGRNTFEIVQSFGAWPFASTPVVVLSSRASELVAPEGAQCEMMSGAPHEIVARLAERGMQHLYIDGGLTVQRFLEAGLIGMRS